MPPIVLAGPGNALRFTGLGDHVTVPNSSIGNPSASFTIEAWAKLVKGSAIGNNVALVSKHRDEAGSARSGYVIEYDQVNDHISGVVGSSAGWTKVSGGSWFSGSWPESSWHHVAMVYDASLNLLSLYDNGVLQGSAAPAAPPLFNDLDLQLGGSAFFADSFFSGMLDEIRVWYVARSETEIQTTMNQKLTGSESGLISAYQADESSGTNLPDIAGSNDGALVDGPWWVSSGAPVDPRGVIIGSDASSNGSWSGGNPDTWTPSANLSNVAAAEVESRLGSGINVAITTLNEATENGDIHVDADFSWSANTLTLDAGNDILIKAALHATATAGLVMNTQGSGGVLTSFDATGADLQGKVFMQPSNSLTINGEPYTIINSLGELGSTTGTDLQGMDSNTNYALGEPVDASATKTCAWNGYAPTNCYCTGTCGNIPPDGTGFFPVDFHAKFNGLGHAVSGLVIWDGSTSDMGLFSSSSGDLRNLNMLESWVKGQSRVGILVGHSSGTVSNCRARSASVCENCASGVGGVSDVGGLVGLSDGPIRNVVNATYVGLNGYGDPNSFGGIVGSMSGTIDNAANSGVVAVGAGIVGTLTGDITSSRNYGAIKSGSGLATQLSGSMNASFNTGDVSYGSSYAGGLVGQRSTGGFITITNCYNSGDVSGGSFTGGITGSGGTITNCRNSGAISGIDYVGGLNGGYGTVSNSWNAGAVSGEDDVGGLIGGLGSVSNSSNQGAVSGTGWRVGGAIGDARKNLENIVNTGAVSGNRYVGGLVGELRAADISASYSTGSVTGNSILGGLVGSVEADGALVNSFFNAEAVLVNGGMLLGPGALYDGQWQDWIEDKALDIADYPNLSLNGDFYEVSSFQGLKDLLGFAEEPAYRFRLASDFDFTGVTGFFIPYLAADEFDGGGHTIANFSLSLASVVANQGFIGHFLGNQISNLNLTDLNVQALSGAFYTGGLVGFASSDFSNISATGSVSGGSNVGGLIGNLAESSRVLTVSDSSFDGNVSGTFNVGGVMGIAAAYVINTHHSGSVSCTDGDCGGLAGYFGGEMIDSSNSGDLTCDFQDCGGLAGYGDVVRSSYNTASVTCHADYCGGLIGYSWGGAEIHDSYNSGSVSGVSYTGGLAGTQTSVFRSFNTGYVQSTTNFSGALIGLDGYVEDSYFDKDTSGKTNCIGYDAQACTGLTTAQMKQLSSFPGWDMDDASFTAKTWRVYQGDSYPLLRHFLTPLTVTADHAHKLYDGNPYTDPLTNPSYSVPGADSSGHLFSLSDPYRSATDIGVYAPKLYSDQAGYDIGYEDALLLINQAVAVLTAPVTNMTPVAAEGGGEVLDDYGNAVTARGVCWSTSGSPTTADTCTSDGNGTGTFVSHVTALSPETSYFLRAYATNGLGTDYGAEKSFTTPAAVLVTTAAVTNISPTTATGGGEVVEDYGDPVTARGLCWNTSGSPTTADTCSSDGSGLGVFSSSISGLTPDTSYFVRAYAENGTGTGYGDQKQFVTPMIPPGNALNFNGTNSYAGIPDASDLDMTTNYTLEAWFKADSLGEAGNLRGLISKYQTSAANGYFLRLNGNELQFDEMTTSGLNLQTGKWYHVAAVNADGTRRLYLNGIEQVLSGTPITVVANSNQLRLGSDFNGRLFAGHLEEARIWAIPRTLEEIRDAMHKGLDSAESGLVGYYKFDQNSGTTVSDSTGKHPGIMYGTTSGVWVASSAPFADGISVLSNLRAVWDGNSTSLASTRFGVSQATLNAPDYAIFGHDNGLDQWQVTDVPSGIARRLTRAWQAELAGSVSGDVQVDTSGLVDISDGSTLALLVDGDGTFADATAVSGNFAAGIFTVSAQSLADGSYYTLGAVEQWLVTPSAGADGAISPDTAQTVNHNSSAVFSIKPDAGFRIDTPVGGSCGGSYSGNPGDSVLGISYTTNPVVADCTVEATFTQSPYNDPPKEPSALNPADGSLDVSLTPVLQGSAFSDPNGDNQDASWWQVDADGSFAFPVWDAVGGASTQETVPSGILGFDTQYYWRVRYRDEPGDWSDWSSPSVFTTQSDVATECHQGSLNLVGPEVFSVDTIIRAEQGITTEGSVQLDPGGGSIQVLFEVGESVTLGPLFQDMSGAGFRVRIAPVDCGAP